MISLAKTREERAAAERLWISEFPGEVVHEGKVCDPEEDHIYLDLVAQVHLDGRLVGAAHTRPLRSLAGQANDPDDPLCDGAKRLLPRYIEIDSMAVRADARGRGFGRAMVEFLEPMLAARGGKMLFGSVTSADKKQFLRAYYSALGFTCMADGEPLPPFGGFEPQHRDWSTVQFMFWRRLRA